MKVCGESKHKWDAQFRLRITVGIALLGIAPVVAFFYFDREGAISVPIRSWGAWGIIVSISLMALFSVVPVPGEFLLILNMKIYGIVLGIFYAWLGTVAGAFAAFVIARYLAAPWIRGMITEQNWAKVESWVIRGGAFGLLSARLLPLPAPIVNYAAGLMESISFWNYLWTASVAIWPYYLAAACIYGGIPGQFSPWLGLGIALLIALWIVGYVLNKRSKIIAR